MYYCSDQEIQASKHSHSITRLDSSVAQLASASDCYQVAIGRFTVQACAGEQKVFLFALLVGQLLGGEKALGLAFRERDSGFRFVGSLESVQNVYQQQLTCSIGRRFELTCLFEAHSILISSLHARPGSLLPHLPILSAGCVFRSHHAKWSHSRCGSSCMRLLLPERT